MPLEIRELVIKVTVNEGANQPGRPNAGNGQASGPNAGAGSQELLDQCVEQVIEILKRRRER